MGYVDARHYRFFPGDGGVHAPAIYVIDSPEHPFEVTPFAEPRHTNIITLPVHNWNDALTPWPATGLYRGEPDFGGEALLTLKELVNGTISSIERESGLFPAARAICGYSLGGLFAMYALVHADVFYACACLSGSVWYEGWVEHLQALDFDLAGRYAYLSLGIKERRAARPILKTVQERMTACEDILKAHGATVDFCMVPGNHLQHIPERLGAGLEALDRFMQ